MCSDAIVLSGRNIPVTAVTRSRYRPTIFVIKPKRRPAHRRNNFPARLSSWGCPRTCTAPCSQAKRHFCEGDGEGDGDFDSRVVDADGRKPGGIDDPGTGSVLRWDDPGHRGREHDVDELHGRGHDSGGLGTVGLLAGVRRADVRWPPRRAAERFCLLGTDMADLLPVALPAHLR